MLGLLFSSKLGWGYYIVSIDKTTSKKIGALICDMKFASAEVAFNLYKASTQPCLKCCCNVFPGTSKCYLDMLI